MSDFYFIALLACFACLSWGLIALCDRIKGEGK